MHSYNKVVLALGSNLGDKKNNLLQTINAIHSNIGVVVQTSAIYETPAWGFESFPFYNMCIAIHTHLNANDLLFNIKSLEKELGRTEKTSASYEARIVDIDIIYFNNEIITSEDLSIPHVHLHQRKFVLVPLSDLDIDWKHPVLNKSTTELLKVCEDESIINKIENVEPPIDHFKSIKDLSFIAIEGNIGAGKTTLTHKIAQDFNGKTIFERFDDNPFLPKFYEEPTRYAFPLEMSFLADRYAQLQAAIGQFNLFNEFIIADYYIYKSLIFAQVTLDKDEALLYRTIFDVMNKDVTTPDLYIYLHQNTKNLLRNIEKRGRKYEELIKNDYLDNITRGYSEFIKTLPQEKVLIIDVTDLDFVENQSDYLKVLNIITDKIKQLKN